MLSLFKKATATPFGQKQQKAHPPLTRRPCVWYYSINFISLSKTVKRSSIRSAAEHRERPTLGTPRPHAGEVASESRTQRNTRPAAPHRSGSPAALPSRLRRALPTLQGTGNRRAAGAVLDLGLSASRRARARHRARTQVVPRGKTASCCREIGGRAFFVVPAGSACRGPRDFPRDAPSPRSSLPGFTPLPACGRPPFPRLLLRRADAPLSAAHTSLTNVILPSGGFYHD